MLRWPIVQREPLPGTLQADLNKVTGILVIDSRIPDRYVPVFRAEAMLALNGRRDLCEYIEQPRPQLTCIRGGLLTGEDAC